MAHFAEIDPSGTVLRVIVADQAFIADMPGTWVQTSYSGAIRKNFAGIGYTYDAGRDAFIPPKPQDDAVLNEETCQWSVPE